MTKITGIAGYSFTCKSCKKEIDIDCLNSLQGNGFNAHGLTHHCICLDCLDNYVDHCDIDNNDTTLIPREYACKCCSKTVEVEQIKNNEYCGNESISLQVCVNCFDSEVSVAEGGYLVIINTTQMDLLSRFGLMRMATQNIYKQKTGIFTDLLML